MTRTLQEKQGYVYILTNEYNTSLYIGVTSDLIKRVYEHKNKLIECFSKKYNLTKLVYFEQFDNIINAIAREKQLKNWHRKWKFNLIEASNPKYIDLYSEITDLNCHAELVSASHDLAIPKQVRNDGGVVCK